MKKALVKGISVIATILIMTSLMAVGIFASPSQQDGLEVNTSTDKENYSEIDQAIVDLSIKNTNGYDVKDIEIEISVPNNLYLVGTETSFKIPILKSGELKEYKATVERQEQTIAVPNLENTKVETGDITEIGEIICLLIISLMILLSLKKYYKLKNFIVIVLLSGMVISNFYMIPINAQQNQLTTKELNRVQNIKFGSETYPIGVKITYAVEEGKVNTSGEITREQWIVKLIDTLKLSSEFDDYSFDDYNNTLEANKIETAIQYGIVKLDQTENNETLFSPKEYATREFVAYTTIKGLGFVTNTNVLECNDKELLTYPNEDYLAVHYGMLKLIQNCFNPNQYVSLTEIETIMAKIIEIENSTIINENHEDKITYREDVKEYTAFYQLDKEHHQITIEDSEIIPMKIGDKVILNNKDNVKDNIAIKIENITNENGQYMIAYNVPTIDEIISNMQAEGKTDNQKATFTPAEDVMVENTKANSRSSTLGEIPLNAAVSLNTKVKLSANDTIDLKAELNLKEIQYRFNIDVSIFQGVEINDAYLAVLLDNNITATYKKELDYNSNKEIKKKLGDINCPLSSGFNASSEVYLVATINGTVKFTIETNMKTGFQLIKGNLRNVSSVETKIPSVELGAKVKLGINPELGVEFWGMDIASIGAEGGICADGTLSNFQSDAIKFCLASNLYTYSFIEARLGPDILNLKLKIDMYTKDNSPFKKKMHFEETGRVEACTRKGNYYQGVVKQSTYPFSPVQSVKIQVYKDKQLLDTIYSQKNGDFMGSKLSNGEYRLLATAKGYNSYEQKFNIVDGKITNIEIRLEKTSGSDNANSILLETGKSYRITSLTGIVIRATEASNISFCEENGSMKYQFDVKANSTTNVVSNGEVLEITINSGNLIMEPSTHIVDGEQICPPINQAGTYELIDHDALYAVALNAGERVNFDNQFYNGDIIDGEVKVSWRGDNKATYTRTVTDYWWNKYLGWEIGKNIYQETAGNTNGNGWYGAVASCNIEKWEVLEGRLFVYVRYTDKDKLVIY